MYSLKYSKENSNSNDNELLVVNNFEEKISAVSVFNNVNNEIDQA